MKNSKFIKLFSALLCIVMLFVSCDNNDNNTPPPEPNPLTFTDIFTSDFESENVVFTSAEKVDLGSIATGTNYLAMFYEMKPDHLGRTVTTYNVYNTLAGKSVLTLECVYDPAVQAEHDNLGGPIVDQPIPEILSENLIAVTTYSAAKLTDEQIKAYVDSFAKVDPEYAYYAENELSTVYLYTATVDFYDGMGNKITTYKSQPAFEPEVDVDSLVYSLGSTGDGCKVIMVYDKIVTVDTKDYSAVKIDAIDTSIVHNYDAECGKYGYYLDVYTAAMMPAIQVYDMETGELKLQHIVETDFTDVDYGTFFEMEPVSAYVLDNGNVYVSVCVPLTEDAEEYDVIIPMGQDTKCRINSYILNVTTGETKTVENAGTVIATLYSYTDMKKMAELDDEKMMFTDKATNIAITVGIYNKTYNPMDQKLVILDNDMNVIYTLDLSSLAYEADIIEGLEGLEFLSTGDLRIKLAENTAAEYAIVKTDGTLRCYVPAGATVGEGFIYKNGVIYDYDLKVLCDLEDKSFNFTDSDKPFDSVRVLGNAFIVTDNYKVTVSNPVGTGTHDETRTRYYLVKADGTGYTKTEIFEDEEIYSSNRNEYIITRSEDDGKYILYNINLEKVLVSENYINVSTIDDVMYASTEKDGEYTLYLLK